MIPQPPGAIVLTEEDHLSLAAEAMTTIVGRGFETWPLTPTFLLNLIVALKDRIELGQCGEAVVELAEARNALLAKFLIFVKLTSLHASRHQYAPSLLHDLDALNIFSHRAFISFISQFRVISPSH